MSSVTAFRLAWLILLAIAGGMGLVIWLGWDGNEAQRIDWFGYGFLSVISMAGLFGLGELIAGPLQNIKIKAGPVEVEIDGDEAPKGSPND